MNSKRFSTYLLTMLISSYVFGQLQGNVATIPDSSNIFNNATAVITISPYFEKDSTGYKISCTKVEGKDAILIKTNKYKGLVIDFHRSMSKSMFKQPLESLETELSLRTIFSGKFYLDIIDPNGIKIKTFIIEKTF